MNLLAVLCAAAAYWLLGAVWYSMVFSAPWRQAVEQHGIKLRPGGMAMKLIVTFIANLIAVLVLGRMFHQLHVVDILRGIKIGAAVGVGFAATALTINYVWQSPKTLAYRLWLPHCGLHIDGLNPLSMAIMDFS